MANKQINGLTAKTTIVDADEFIIHDSAEGGSEAQKKITFANAIGYAVGTWTPIAYDADTDGNAASSTTPLGTYTKIGRQVTVTCKLTDIDTTGLTAGSQLNIGGLPFARQETTAVAYTSAALAAWVAWTDGVIASFGSGRERIILIDLAQGGSQTAVIVSDLTSASADIGFTLTYEV